MHLYSGTTSAFRADAGRGEIAAKLSEAFVRQFSHRPGAAEVQSWQNSLRAMADVIALADLDEHGVVVEWTLPLSSRRLDVMVTGRRPDGPPSAVIVELKQWTGVEASSVEKCVATHVGGRVRDVLHPSVQVGGYHRYLLDVHTAFTSGEVALEACAFAHNTAHDPSHELFADRWADEIAAHPLFAGNQIDQLADYLATNLAGGEGVSTLDAVMRGKYRPHKRLLDHTAAVIRNEPAYVLLDEQRVVFEKVLARVRARTLSPRKCVVIVQGGPGTGKSVVAVNLVAALAAQNLVVHHVTGSKAFTENMRKAVGPRAKALFGYTNQYIDPETQVDAIVCDEAHRIREVSHTRWATRDKRSTKPQIDELIGAAKLSVFFIDDLQIVRPGELGSSTLIREAAQRLGADVIEEELEAQFRCNGSDAFIQWVDTTLEIRRTPTVLWDPADGFDLDVVDSVEELEAHIRSRAADGFTARLSAGYCWPWSKPRADGTLENDVKIGDWSMPWNAMPDAGRLAEGIPKANHWASDPGGLEQVGCVYTAQGFEYDYAGVIWGRDLVYRAREGWVAQPAHSKDRIVRQAVKFGSFEGLVKNTYRVLLTRGLLGCSIYFEDPETEAFVLSRIARARP